MRVLVAGATGVVGRPLCRRLIAAGHEVHALTRTAQGAEALRAAGVTPIVADVFDEAAVIAAAKTAAPHAVVHQLTALPAAFSPRQATRVLEPTNRLRTEGTRILLAAARAAGATRFVAQSISFLLRPDGDRAVAKTEADPIWTDAPGFGAIHRACASLEEQVCGARELTGIALRFGSFYGPGTVYAPGGSLHAGVRKRRVPLVGRGDGVVSFTHVDDAAAATVCALAGGPAGVYHIVDDEPAPARDWLPVYAAAIAAKPPRRIPRWLARLGAGRYAIYMLCEQRGVSNAKAKAALGWVPSITSWRTGFVTRLDT